MKKWIPSFLALILVAFSLHQSRAQVISLGQVTGLVGDTVSVPVIYNGPNPLTMSALTLAINYDSTRLQCLSQVIGLNPLISSSNLLTNCGLFSGTGANLNISTSQFRLVWYDLNPATVNGLLFNIRMVVLRTGNASVEWDLATPSLVEVGDQDGNPVGGLTFANGSVQGFLPPTLSIGSVSGLVGDTLSVPVTLSGPNPLTMSALTLAINYDSSRLQCLSQVVNVNPSLSSSNLLTNCGFFGGTGSSLNASASQFRLSWYDLSPATLNGVLFNVRFVVLRSGSATLNWDLATPGLVEVGDQDGNPINGLTFNNGSVQVIPYPTLNIGSVNGRVGDSVSVPVHIQMDSIFKVGAISLSINFDSTRLRCAGLPTSINPALSSSLIGNCGYFNNLGANFTDSGSQFRAGWFDANAIHVNGLLFNMRFVILQSGPTSLSFDLATAGNCELADSNAAPLSNVTYTGGVVTGHLGTISFGSRFKAVAENGSGAFIPVTLTNVSSLPATGSFRISLLSTWSNGTSADLSGWQTQRIQVTNSPTAIQIPLTINNDALVEDDEYLVFKIDSLEGLTLSGPDFFTYYITDDDRQAPVSSGAVQMTPLVSFDPTPGLAATTEVVVYDPVSKRAFLSSGVQRRFDMVSLANPSAPVTLGSVSMQPYGGITGLAVKPGLLAVASPDSIEQNPGRVIFFDTLGNYKGQVTVGALPDMITFTPDGKYLLTANEGQPNSDFSNDPEGSVSIIDGQDTTYVQSDVTTLNFTGFNAISASLMASGVRKGSTIGTLSQNLEPEYITVSSDNTKAWVTLQENNSIAHLDLVNKIVTNITPMGMKNHQTAQNGFDASDNNGVVLMTNWPVRSFYMPDAIGNFTVGNTTYLVTANEGDEREYDVLNERTTVGAVSLDATRFPNGAMLKESHALGRLRITNQSGDLDGDGDYDELHMVGPRSFAIYNAATGAQVYESKNLIESIVLADPTWGPFFNADSENNTRKNRSRSKGPEPEGVAVGKIGSRTFAFIALERVGGVMAFEVTNPSAPVFSGYLNTRSTTGLAGDRGAEVIQFLGHDQSPNGKPMLLVANEISGTLALYEVGMGFNLLSGRLTYANTQATALVGDTLRLVNTNGQVVATTTSGTDGQFSLENFAAGTYQVRGNASRAWGGVNATDALEARRIYQGLLNPTPIVALAADVNASNLVNNTDALMIIRRSNGSINAFPSGNWQYSSGTLDFSTGRLLQTSVTSLASGDVNASYFGSTSGRLALPRLLPSNTAVGLEQGQTQRVAVLAGKTMEMGAMTLDLPWPNGLELVSIRANMGENALLHHLVDGRLRMGWAAPEGHKVRTGDVLFEMELRAEEGVEVDFSALTLGSMSEIADPMAQTITDASLVMPRLASKSRLMGQLQVWPNPARDVLNIQLALESGIHSYSLEMIDALGRVVKSDYQAVTAGELRTKLSLDGIPSGTYLVRLGLTDVSGTTKTIVQRVKVQL